MGAVEASSAGSSMFMSKRQSRVPSESDPAKELSSLSVEQMDTGDTVRARLRAVGLFVRFLVAVVVVFR